jgi:cell division protein FtsW
VSSTHVAARVLTLVTLSLVAFGLVMVYSATSAPAAIGGGEPSGYLQRQAIYAVAGLVLMILVSRVDRRALRGVAPALLAVSFVLCVAVLVVGTPVNGARRWFFVGPVSFQPSELAKLALAIWVAAYLARRPAPATLGELARPVGVVFALFLGLLLLQPDLDVSLLVMLAAVLLVAGTPVRTLVGAGTIVAAVGLAAMWLAPYRRARLLSFLDPWSDAQGFGFQSVQALIGFGSGGWLGRGLGEGIGKINYLPEAHTDMIFAVIGEELGLVGTTAVILAYCAFAYAGLRIALAAREPFAKLLAVALTALVCGQAAINLMAVLGLAPLTGVPLPLVSYGGSSLVVQLAAVGILLNIANVRGAEGRAAGADRGRRDGRPRPARARSGGGARPARRERDVRRVAGSRRGAARS